MNRENIIEKTVKDWTQIESTFSEEKLGWCLTHCQSKFWQRGDRWYFSNDNDATVFLLKHSENHEGIRVKTF